MRVLHLVSEFPPYKIGGLGTHVEELTKAQVKQGIEPIVVTCAFEGKQGYENKEGVHVFRFDADNIPAEDFPSWALQMNVLMQNQATEVIDEFGEISLIHAHDWLVVTAGANLKHMYRIPLVSTIHSLELGRRGGIHQDRQKLIHDLEGRLVYESWQVIACSNYMKQTICSCFGAPWDKIDVINNGVDVGNFNGKNIDFNAIREGFALPHEKIVFFIGRHVWEKGLDVLVGAVPSILEEIPDAKFVIAGEGYMTGKCQELANQMGVGDKVQFAGHVDDLTMNSLLHLADVVAVPSRYEPFGIVALEAMACHTPVVVADTGGLSEIVEHEKDGLKVWPGHSESLAYGIKRILKEDKLAQQIRTSAYEKAEKVYAWNNVTKTTKGVYDQVCEEYQKNTWKPRKVRLGSPSGL